ncbi:FkbM family methyltransferase [Acutalibacter sp. 1XD8-33]|uniref:FkbM family methyltransferase n=1 Tax=Acutalibacter sp. 1XD8-33 TaxID=2320081 RepID=UPI000EA1BE7E|nr:FkbM family methyltransferase [Acutalibacter sp. 1XD8-33]RKJ41982.1 FkbM family methyltransferase [Acutalibacter sp. 1XD8-33]
MGGGYNPINPAYFIDDTPEKQGTTFLGRPVINYEEAHELCKGYVILVCSGSPQARKIIFDGLRNDGVEDADFCGFQEYFFCANRDKVLAVFDMLEDDLSKATYANLILLRMERAEQAQDLVRNPAYFDIPVFVKADKNEVFVDCGAYVGDTVEEYLFSHMMFKKIVAFEPSDMAFQALSARVERLKKEWAIPDEKFELVQAGVGEGNYQADKKYADEQLKNGIQLCALKIEKVSEPIENAIPVYALDDYFAEQPLSFIKVDIEGYEWKMLIGAENVIKRDKPKMALSIYHMPVDMFRLAIKLKEICPEYKFYVRQDQPSWEDTVLCAYVEKPSGILE